MEERVAALETQVAVLEDRIHCLEEGGAFGPEDLFGGRRSPPRKDAAPAPEVSEEALSWAGRASVLPRIAALSFILVVALGLRSVADSGIVDKLIGSALGMGYAAGLMIASWFFYRRKSPYAPVMAVTGAILISTVVVETHMHFRSLPLIPAYLTLMATGLGTAVLSRRFSTFVPVSAGILGMCFAGAAMDFPNPSYPYLSLILITANALGFYASRLKSGSWLRWLVLLVTCGMTGTWGMHLAASIKVGSIPETLAYPYFFPVIAILLLGYFLMALAGMLREAKERVSTFDLLLWPLNAAWAGLVLTGVLGAFKGGLWVSALVAGLLAVGHFASAFVLAGRKGKGASGTTSMLAAGAILLALALPRAADFFAFGLPLVGVAALLVENRSRAWNSGAVRVTAHSMQLFTSLALLVFAVFFPGGGLLLMIPTLLVAATGVYHYAWARMNVPPLPSLIFEKLDPRDRGAILLLVGGLVASFLAYRSGLWFLLSSWEEVARRSAFICYQTTVITAAAIGILLIASNRHMRDLRNLALLLVIGGGIKALLFDMFTASGLPLIVDVFTFGLAAATASIVLGKWAKSSARDGRGGSASAG